MNVSMFLSLLCCALDIFATVKRVNHGRKYNWKYLQIFIFMDLKSSLNWLKNKITIIEENFNGTIKRCLK